MVLHGQWTWHNLHHVHKSYWNKYTTHCVLQGLVFLDTLSFWQFSACKERFYINIDLGSQRLDIFAYTISWLLIFKGQYYANRYRSAEGTVCIFSFFWCNWFLAELVNSWSTGSWSNPPIFKFSHSHCCCAYAATETFVLFVTWCFLAFDPQWIIWCFPLKEVSPQGCLPFLKGHELSDSSSGLVVFLVASACCCCEECCLSFCP